MMKFKLLQENGFEDNLKISTAGLKNLFSADGLVLNENETTWKNKV
jgi:hypothetical protein